MSIAIRWIVLLPFVCICAAQEDVIHQIQQLASPGDAEVLGAKLLREARAPAAAVAAAWQSGDPLVSKNARTVLNEMEEAALNPLLQASGTLAPAEQAWRMTMVVETIGDLRKTAATMLDRQLTNKQLAPLPSMPGAEEHEPNRRTCDEAYVLMNRLIAGDDQSESFVLRMRQFRQMSESARDAEIHRARQSATWRSLLR